MAGNTAITINRPRAEVEQHWREQSAQDDAVKDARVRFADAPGDRGTEVHLALEPSGLTGKIMASARLAKAKDSLRHFKQRVETGEITRSEHAPEGERVERKFKRRPAQPLEEVGAR